MRIAPAVELMAPERQQLTQWARGRRTPARLVLRAKIVLLAAAGHDNQQIAAAVATSRQTVGLWRHADTRLYAPWHHHALCRSACGQRRDYLHLSAPPLARGMAAVFTAD